MELRLIVFVILFGIIGTDAQSNATQNLTTVSPTSSTIAPKVDQSVPKQETFNETEEEFSSVDDDESFEADLALLLPSDYVPYQLPVTDSLQFVPVFLSLFIRSVADINEKDEQLTLETNFARRWIDYKISKRVIGPLKNITLGSTALDHIWTPDIFFDGTSPPNKDTEETTQKTVKVIFNATDIRDAQIAYSERTRLKLDCSMEFHYYPADIQSCTYYIRSFSYKQNRLKLFWEKENPVFLLETEHPNFDLLVESVWPSIEANGTNKLYLEETFDPFRKGNYSALTFTIKARRKLSYHLVQTYLPSILLILMTWLCFLIPTDMVEARIGISMTTVLTLTAMFAAVRGQAPSVSYTMAIDIWMVFCIFIVFVALSLFTVTYWMKSKIMKGRQNDNTDIDIDNPKEETYLNKWFLHFTKYYAFTIFALTFVIFVILYWWWLLVSSKYFGWDPNPTMNFEDGLSDEENSPFYRYIISDSVYLFDGTIYSPAAQKILKSVFALVR